MRHLQTSLFCTTIALVLLTGCARVPVRTTPAPLDGLMPMRTIDQTKVRMAVPRAWEAMPAKRALLYTHQYWRSPDTVTAVGVVYIRLPVPLTPGALVTLARLEYGKVKGENKVVGQWTDDLGREWFEGENARYHVRGYAVIGGLEAWIVYTSDRLGMTPDPRDQATAERSLQTVAPVAPVARATSP